MNINDFKIFEAVAEHGSFTKAAAAMFTVQSNVTARIKSLEEEFGVQLFSRASRRVEITVAGEKLMHYCREIGQLVEEAKRELSEEDQVTGHLKIGCIETTMALKAPGIIHEFSEAYPDVELEFKSAMREELINDVMHYKLDAAFVSAPVNIPELEQHKVKEEQLVIVASADAVDLKSLLKAKQLRIVVFDQGCIYRARLESWLTTKDIVQYKSIVVNSLEGIINFVAAGLAITILPADLVKQYYANRKLKTFTIDKALGTSTTLIVFRKSNVQNRALQAFVEMYE